MAGSPERPAQVPAAAVWIETSGEWELAAPGADADRSGLARTWRADGTLRNETPYEKGAPHGLARRFHPDGSVARQMQFVNGQLDGTVVARAAELPAAEQLQPCCVPPNAWEMQLDYELGNFLGQRWYDRAGVHILPSGKPFPPRPANLPADARFDEESDRWLTGSYNDKAELHGEWLRWSRDGVLIERDNYDHARAHGLWQRFTPGGVLLEEANFQHALRHGPYRQTHVPPGRYPDSRITEERGTFDQDQAVGIWTLHDDDGQQLRQVNLGVAVPRDDATQSPALAPAPPPATTGGVPGRWRSLAATLEQQGRIGEAILALARAAAAARTADDLRLELARLQMSLTMANSEELAQQLIRAADGQLALLINALPRGADAARVLRAIAAAREGSDEVSMDLVETAILLDPTAHECRVTRALLQLHRGHPLAARLDAESLPDEWSEQRDFLLGYARALFPVFDFWPTKRPIETLLADIPEQPDQDLEAVRDQIQKYATRLMAVRAAIAEFLRADGDHPRPWLLPDLSALLPDGPVSLETWEFEEIVVDDEAPEGDAAPEGAAAPADSKPTLVTVDERLPLENQSLATLMRIARREWSALTWLCWSAGLEHVALPTTLAPPANFGIAAGMTVQRLWRCRDKLTTGGLRAVSQGVPSFDWEGVAIDSMTPVLTEIALLEYLELRALFFWLCDSGVQSPWQDNLRSES